jgi:subtilisin-like proprotein convertase family protein
MRIIFNVTSFGLISVCFTILHSYDGDLDIKLKVPDGTTINLSNNNGGELDDFNETCAKENAASAKTGRNESFLKLVKL